MRSVIPPSVLSSPLFLSVFPTMHSLQAEADTSVHSVSSQAPEEINTLSSKGPPKLVSAEGLFRNKFEVHRGILK